MNATTQAASDYLTLLRKLMGTKLTASTAIALLEESATWIDALVKAPRDAEKSLDMWRDGYERGCEDTEAAALPVAGADGVVVFGPMPVSEVLAGASQGPACACGLLTPWRCSSNLTHDQDVPVCRVHSVPNPEAPDGGRECLKCAELREQQAAGGHALRPPQWQCSRCQLRFDGRKPEDGICTGCEELPLRAAAPAYECGAKHEGFRCNADGVHTVGPGTDHAEWRADGTIAARWPAAAQPEPPRLRLTPVPPVHWLNLDSDDPERNACGAPDGPALPGMVAADSDKGQVTCLACWAVPGFADQPPVVHWLNAGDGDGVAACALAADVPDADLAVTAGKTGVTCQACRALPEFGPPLAVVPDGDGDLPDGVVPFTVPAGGAK